MPKKRPQNPVPEESSDDGSNDVQMVYGDLMTFVMMLFVLLFVLSYNDNKTHDFVTELQIKFGEHIEEQQQTLTTDALLVSKINHYIDKEDLEDYAQVLVDEHRVKLILNPPVLFNIGKAFIKPKGYPILDGIGEIFDSVNNPLVIEGHTDDVPINNDEFSSNWELSFERAFSIIKYFIYSRKYKPTRLSALGYGEYRPLADNSTIEGRSLNRRIEINVIRLTPADEEGFNEDFN